MRPFPATFATRLEMQMAIGKSTALDSDCEQRRGVYGKRASGDRVCAWFINYRQRAKVADREGEWERGGERAQVNAAQATSPSGVLQLSRTL